jgi:hypothetical protein
LLWLFWKWGLLNSLPGLASNYGFITLSALWGRAHIGQRIRHGPCLSRMVNRLTFQRMKSISWLL